MAASQKGQSTRSAARAENARKIAEKYSGAGISFRVKYLGTQEVSSAKGDAVVADCLKELRSLFRDMATHLPKVTVTLQLSGITVQDEKSQLETLKAPLDHISYVCLDPADSSVFSFIIRSPDTISSKGLRLHAFMTDPQTAITFNRSARELFDFVARMMRAKKKLAQQPAAVPSVDTQGQSSSTKTQKEPLYDEPVPVLAPPPPGPQRPSLKSASPPPQPQAQPHPPDNTASEENIYQVPTGRPAPDTAQSEEVKRQAVFDEWKVLDKELSTIAEDLGLGPLEPAVSPSSSSPPTFPTYDTAMADPTSTTAPPPTQQPTPFDILTTSSGADPFDSSFFDLSFGGDTQAPTTTIAETASPSHTPQIFDNPVFNGHIESPPTSSEPNVPPPLTSTPESKKEGYASRPRPKGKLSVDNIVPLPTVPAQLPAQQTREVSLSPTGEEQVMSILSNTDPFQTPSLEPFQSPSVANGGTFFQPPPLTHNTSSPSLFSPSSATPQGSIQVANPLYQSYSFDGSFSAPFGSPTLPLQQPMMSPGPVMQGGMQVQTQFPVIPPPAVQPVPMAQTQSPQAAVFTAQGAQIPPTGMAFPGSILSPTVLSPPPPTSPSQGSATKARSGSYPFKSREETDSMFADLIPVGTLSPEKASTKKAEFEKPTKPPLPSLAELQETKMKWTAFEGSKQAADTGGMSQDSGIVEWLTSPFDDSHSSTEPALGEALEPLDTLLKVEKGPVQSPEAEDQQVPDSTGKTTQAKPAAEANALLDFEAAFQEAGSKEHNIDSAFEVKFDSKPKSQPPPPAATNDPFTTSGSSVASSEKEPSGPWVAF